MMPRPFLHQHLTTLSLRCTTQSWPQKPLTTFAGHGVKILIDEREVVWVSRDDWKIKFDAAVPDEVVAASVDALHVGV